MNFEEYMKDRSWWSERQTREHKWRRQRRSSAFHEAGHAFWVWLTGGIVITVTSNEESARTFYKHPGQFPEKKWDDPDVLNYVAMSLAGLCAQYRVDAAFWDTDHSGKNDIIEAIAFLVHRGWEGSEGKPWWKYDLDDFFFEFTSLVPVRSNIFDQGYWNCITALGEALLDKGELDGKECVTIILDNWQRELPEKALPIEKHGEKNKEVEQ